MRWIESAGGPLLLLSEESLKDWGGVRELMTGPAAKHSWSPDGKPTDYDRACSVDGYVGLIPVGDDYGVVFGDEPSSTTWIPNQSENGGTCVRWVFGENESEFLSWIQKIPESIFRPSEIFVVKKPSQILFDSALAGHNVKKKAEEYLSITLKLGLYEIRTAIYQPDARTSMVVHRFETSSK
jgi:hypothetical protein